MQKFNTILVIESLCDTVGQSPWAKLSRPTCGYIHSEEIVPLSRCSLQSWSAKTLRGSIWTDAMLCGEVVSIIVVQKPLFALRLHCYWPLTITWTRACTRWRWIRMVMNIEDISKIVFESPPSPIFPLTLNCTAGHHGTISLCRIEITSPPFPPFLVLVPYLALTNAHHFLQEI